MRWHGCAFFEVNLLLLVFVDLDVLKLVHVIQTEPFLSSWFIFPPTFFSLKINGSESL